MACLLELSFVIVEMKSHLEFSKVRTTFTKQRTKAAFTGNLVLKSSGTKAPGSLAIPSNTDNDVPDKDGDKDGLSGVAIACIVIGAIVFFYFFIFLFL